VIQSTAVMLWHEPVRLRWITTTLQSAPPHISGLGFVCAAISASDNQRSVASGIDAFIKTDGTLPPAFQNLLGFQSSSQLAESFTQLSGEAGIGTGTAQAGTQAMNSFLSLVTNPFGDNRSLRAGDRAFAFAYYKAPV
jgi:hypothetical protein